MNWFPRLSDKVCVGVLVATVAACVSCDRQSAAPKVDRQIVALTSYATLLESVTDPASAEKATPAIQPIFDEIVDATEILIEASDREGEVEVRKRDAERLKKQRSSAKAKVRKELERIRAIDEMPVVFWNAIRLAEVRQIVSEAESMLSQGQEIDFKMYEIYARMKKLFEKHGVDKVVEVEVCREGSAARPAPLISKRLQVAASPEAEVVYYSSGVGKLSSGFYYVSPVADFDGFVEQLAFLRKKEVSSSHRTVRLNATFGVTEFLEEWDAEHEWERMEKIGGDERLLWLVQQAENYNGYISFDYTPYREKAIAILHRTDPNSVEKKETRAEIAEFFKKNLDSNGSSYISSPARYVDWAGEDAYPVILSYCENDGVKCYRALAKFKNPEVVDFFLNHVDVRGRWMPSRHPAIQCLGTMGSMAETGLLSKLESGEIKPTSEIAELLGKIGTSRSLPWLRENVQSMNDRRAIRAIELIESRGGEPVAPTRP